MALLEKYRAKPHGINDDGIREIARRIRAGESVRQVADAIGWSPSSTRAQVNRLRSILGIPSPADVRDERDYAFAALMDEGVPGREIGRRLGMTDNQVRHTRSRLGLSLYRKTDTTETERAEIARRFAAGERLSEIARSMSLCISTVREYAKRTEAAPDENQACGCGRERNHRGACGISQSKLEICERRLRDGVPIREIASEVGYSKGGLMLAIKPLIATLRDQGVQCRCGKLVLHVGACRNGNRIRPAASEIEAIEQSLRAGMSRRAIASETGYDFGVISRVCQPILDEWATEGKMCPCGQPINHRGRCGGWSNPSARGLQRRAQIAFSATSKRLTGKQRTSIRRMAEQGRSDAHIASVLDLSRHFVSSVVADLVASGISFRPCRCGKERNHLGMCRQPAPPRRARPAAAPLHNVPKATRLSIYGMMKAGTSAEKMARRTGISIDRIRAHIRKRISDRKHPLPPCACGREAYHAGGCSKTTPGALSARDIRKVEEMVMNGRTIGEIADDLRITFRVASKHAMPHRERQVAAGVTCACGRPVGHRGVCSATWEASGRPRGKAPIPKALTRRVRTALLRGDSPKDVAAGTGATRNQVLRIRTELDGDDRAARSAVIRRRALYQTSEQECMRLLEMVRKAVPPWVDKASRKEIENDLYVAVAEGRIEEDQLQKAAKSIAIDITRHGRSMDAPIGNDGDLSLHDLVSDMTTAAQIEAMTIGGDHT